MNRFDSLKNNVSQDLGFANIALKVGEKKYISSHLSIHNLIGN